MTGRFMQMYSAREESYAGDVASQAWTRSGTGTRSSGPYSLVTSAAPYRQVRREAVGITLRGIDACGSGHGCGAALCEAVGSAAEQCCVRGWAALFSVHSSMQIGVTRSGAAISLGLVNRQWLCRSCVRVL